MNTNYVKGRAAEYQVVAELRKQGALIAQRTAGSHSLIDVVGLMPDGSVKLIQVKKDSSPLKLADLAELPRKKNVSIELWHRQDGQWIIYK